MPCAGRIRARLTPNASVCAKVTQGATIGASLDKARAPIYDGEYHVDPANEAQTLHTGGYTLLQDVTIGALPDNLIDTTDATLDSGGRMLSGYTAYANGVKYTGTIQTRTADDLTIVGPRFRVPAGYYASQVGKTMENGRVVPPDEITDTGASAETSGGTITLTKSVIVRPVVTKQGFIDGGTSEYVNVSLSAPIPSNYGLITYNGSVITVS